jgi:hypothetical protein
LQQLAGVPCKNPAMLRGYDRHLIFWGGDEMLKMLFKCLIALGVLMLTLVAPDAVAMARVLVEVIA